MIRRAIESYLEDIKRLLNEVLNVHALIRPDLFKQIQENILIKNY
jgi:hypothetical protein